MRCIQLFGLSSEATEFLKLNGQIVPTYKCPHCGGTLAEGIEKKVYASAAEFGMFDDGPELHMYFLKDGKTVKEIVQDSPWSSGPCIFLCLQDEDGKRIGEWPQEDIEQA